MLQSLDDLETALIVRVCYDDVLIEACRRYVAAISRVRDASGLGRMQLLVDEALSHVEVPDADCAVLVDDRRQILHALLRVEQTDLRVRRLITAKTDLVHFTQVRTIDLSNERLATDVPQLDGLVDANRNSKGPIVRGLHRINVALVTLKVRHILT